MPLSEFASFDHGIAMPSIRTPVESFLVIESLKWERCFVVLPGCGRPKSLHSWYWGMLLSEF